MTGKDDYDFVECWDLLVPPLKAKALKPALWVTLMGYHENALNGPDHQRYILYKVSVPLEEVVIENREAVLSLEYQHRGSQVWVLNGAQIQRPNALLPTPFYQGDPFHPIEFNLSALRVVRHTTVRLTLKVVLEPAWT